MIPDMPMHAAGNQKDENLADYVWLTSPAAEEPLQLAACSELSLTSQVAELRKVCSPNRTHLVVEQATLRKRARAKFTAADRMFFTPLGLEQATDETVAGYKAQRFPDGLSVLDFCCGVGGDLLALLDRGPVTGIDRDPISVILARANAIAVHHLKSQLERPSHHLEVVTADVRQVDVSQCAAWHIDPDRRPIGRRTTRVELHEPGPDTIETLIRVNPNAAIKLAPAAQLPPAWHERAELEWISRGRECRQLVAWFGCLAQNAGYRRATVLFGAGANDYRTFLGEATVDPPIADRVGSYLFEPDAAILAAKLENSLTAEHRLNALAPAIAYFTGDQAIRDAALACFEVIEVLPFKLKAVRALLRAHGIGRLEIKKRGVDLDPARLRGDLQLAGDDEATLLVAPIRGTTTAILARRVS